MHTIIPKADFKFFVSWLSCSVVMFGLFYSWHGMILNDFLKVDVPLKIYLSIASLVYLAIGLLMTILTYMLKRIKDSFKYGMAVGAGAGIFIYALAFMLGIGFYTEFKPQIVLFDLAWQVFEQGFGGLVCGWVYRMLYLREKRMNLS